MYYFIVNPKSSSGKGREIWDTLEHRLTSVKCDYRVLFTREKGHATRLAKYISTEKSPCVLVAVGGDGTANEVICGIEDYSKVVFAYIPTGSSNDLARGLNLEKDPAKALEAILHPSTYHSLRIGVSTAEGERRNFAVSSGIGYDAAICHEALNSPIKDFLNKLKLGKLTYTGIALRQLLLLKASPMDIILDGEKKLHYPKVYFTAAMNLKYEGGGFMFCPEADSSDEWLDIIVVEKMSKLKVLMALPTAYYGKHTHFKGIHIFRCRRMSVRTDRSLAVHTDGESFGCRDSLDISLEAIPLKVKIGRASCRERV